MLPFVGFMVFALLGIAALAIDLGFATVQQQRLETLADVRATAALREEARLRYDAMNDELEDEADRRAVCGEELSEFMDCREAPDSSIAVDCDEEASAYETCVDELAIEVADALDEVAVFDPEPADNGSQGGLPNPDVNLGPGPIQHGGPQSCGSLCWESVVTQAVPLLFGQGSLVGFDDTPFRDQLDQRESGTLLSAEGTGLRAGGIRLRARSVAETRPVVAVGRVVQGLDLPGRAPFALELGVFEAFFKADPTRVLDVDGGDLLIGEQRVGRRIQDSDGLRAGSLLSAGTEYARLESDRYAYVPLIQNPPLSTRDVVVGYVFVRYTAPDETIEVEWLPERLAPGNASSSPRYLAGAACIDCALQVHAFYRDPDRDPDRDLFLQAPVQSGRVQP